MVRLAFRPFPFADLELRRLDGPQSLQSKANGLIAESTEA
jgi:hypothetical protein